MNIHVEILEDVAKVYSDSDFLFHFKITEWFKTAVDKNVCSYCNMFNFCDKNIFKTQYSFRELVCQKLGLRLRPDMTKENAKVLCFSTRGKIIKKNLRK